MSLVVFRSKAAGDIFMFADTAQRLFEIIGKQDSQRGVITAAQIPEALAKLTAAVDEERAHLKRDTDDDDAQPDGVNASTASKPVTLGQRAYPLIEMLRLSADKKADVTWGV